MLKKVAYTFGLICCLGGCTQSPSAEESVQSSIRECYTAADSESGECFDELAGESGDAEAIFEVCFEEHIQCIELTGDPEVCDSMLDACFEVYDESDPVVDSLEHCFQEAEACAADFESDGIDGPYPGAPRPDGSNVDGGDDGAPEGPGEEYPEDGPDGSDGWPEDGPPTDHEECPEGPVLCQQILDSCLGSFEQPPGEDERPEEVGELCVDHHRECLESEGDPELCDMIVEECLENTGPQEPGEQECLSAAAVCVEEADSRQSADGCVEFIDICFEPEPPTPCGYEFQVCAEGARSDEELRACEEAIVDCGPYDRPDYDEPPTDEPPTDEPGHEEPPTDEPPTEEPREEPGTDGPSEEPEGEWRN